MVILIGNNKDSTKIRTDWSDWGLEFRKNYKGKKSKKKKSTVVKTDHVNKSVGRIDSWSA